MSSTSRSPSSRRFSLALTRPARSTASTGRLMLFWILGSQLVLGSFSLPVPAQELPDESAYLQAPSTGYRLLVLHDGSVIQGPMTVLEHGYLIERATGKITIPFNSVVCEAKTLPEAYRKQRDAMTKPTADQHTRLANWCYEQKLYAEAERELISALKLQPHHNVARRLIKQLDQRKPKDSDFTNTEWKKQFEKLLIEREFSTAQPLGGLDAPLAQQFASHLEPLLLNSCASGGCHGPNSQREFQLTPKWNLRGNTRHITDQNLEAVLKQIDRTAPEKSPLLTVLNGQHGARGRDVFAGSRAQEHRQVLTRWTHQVAKFLGPPPTSPPTSPLLQVHATESERESDAAMNAPEGSFIQQASAQSMTIPAEPRPLITRGEEIPLLNGRNPLKEVRKEQAFDPFNPDVFNQKMHGRSGRRP